MYSYIDMHCDSLLRVLEQGEESLFNGEGMQSIQKMVEAGQMCQFFAIFFRPEWKKQMEALHIEAWRKADSKEQESKESNSVHFLDEMYFIRLRNALYRQIEAHPTEISMTYNYEKIRANKSVGRASAILTVEDGRIVDGRLERLVWLYEKGVRAITLTWNTANCFGYPNSLDKKVMSRGLTAFGREAIGEMNRLGVLIDVSHLSDGGFWDVAALSDKPFVASHSNCRTLVSHARNLSDDMIVLLAERGGVAGVNLYPTFVKGTEKQGVLSDYIAALAAHVLHFIQIGGEECVGIGTDFDGMEVPLEIDCPTKMELLFDALLKCGLTPRQLDKFVSGNVLRVIKDTMK